MFDTLVTLAVSAAFVVSLAAFAGFTLVRNAGGRPASRVAPWVASAFSVTMSHDTGHSTAVPDRVLRPEPHRS